jgi:biopolymer transport protein TolR
VEVMLVLIIIFMITAPMLNVGVPVNLPKTRAATLAETPSAPIVISIDKDSKIYVEEANVTLAELLQKLPMIVANSKTDTVYVRGDKDLAYGQILEIMGIIAATGACKVSLISEAVGKDDMVDLKNISEAVPEVTSPISIQSRNKEVVQRKPRNPAAGATQASRKGPQALVRRKKR